VAPGRVLLNTRPRAQATNDNNQGPIIPVGKQAHDQDDSVSPYDVHNGVVYFNTKKLEVAVRGGRTATDSITIRLYYESAGDYRF